jgi:hypothetical protein
MFPGRWLASRYGSAPKLDTTFVLDVGALEDHCTMAGSGPPPPGESDRQGADVAAVFISFGSSSVLSTSRQANLRPECRTQ